MSRKRKWTSALDAAILAGQADRRARAAAETAKAIKESTRLAVKFRREMADHLEELRRDDEIYKMIRQAVAAGKDKIVVAGSRAYAAAVNTFEDIEARYEEYETHDPDTGSSLEQQVHITWRK